MNQMENNNKNKSSNSLVFGRWPQTKIYRLKGSSGRTGEIISILIYNSSDKITR